MSEPITIFVVDDEPAVRDSLSLLLEQQGLRAEPYASAEAFLAACRPDRRGCAIVDIRMPGMDGMELQRQLAARGLPLPVVFLTGHGDIPTSVRAIKQGAVDFLTKPVTAAELLASVRGALEEGERLRCRAEETRTAAECLATLTDRERDVMALAIAGYANKEIGQRLGISHRTVEIHKARVMQKTGATTVLDLAQLAQVGGFRT